ncbi:MAG: hypothetical protein LBD91_06280 [Prevotellaceae bacterium]|jgi:hypothetical protein|nr:hypothetical protein [Prevotellaceae bacterium]
MNTIVAKSPLNESQILLLQVFARIRSEEEKIDIQAMLLDYYRKRVDDEARKISLCDEKIEEILNSHYRSHYQ